MVMQSRHTFDHPMVEVIHALSSMGGSSFSQRALTFLSQERYSEFLEETSSWTPQRLLDVGVEDFDFHYFLAEFLSKSRVIETGVDKAAVAMEKFAEAEAICKITNSRWEKIDRCPDLDDPELGPVLFWARHYVATILPEFCWDSVLPLCDFGPGANVALPRRHASKPNKIGLIRPTATQACKPLAELVLKHWAGWGASQNVRKDVEVVPGGNIVTVPKNFKTDRTIVIEPLWNSFFQKGIGKLLKRVLRAQGCNLYDQKPNQEAARQGSRDGSYATIDMKMASDTVSRRFVEWMLPADWLAALDAVRSPQVVLASGEVLFLEKFSSMGNAFTFELESLIFLSLAKAAYAWTKGPCLQPIRVYGDDLAVDHRAASLLMRLLSVCGFIPNSEKTHVCDNGFRESCGKHYLRGQDVSPFYIRDTAQTDHGKFLLANNIVRRATRNFVWGRDKRYRAAYEAARQRITHSHLKKLLIPEGYGDGGLVVDLDEAMAAGAVSRHKRWDGWVTSHLPEVRIPYARPKGKEEPSSVKDTHLLARLLELELRGSDPQGELESEYVYERFMLSARKRPLFVLSLIHI